MWDMTVINVVDGELNVHPGKLQGQDVIWSQVENSRNHSQVWANIAHSC